jgi:hypothetical protein
MDSARYAGHSFRRGGATFAFQCGASPAQIKEQGDWKSSAYLLYLEFVDPARARVAALMGSYGPLHLAYDLAVPRSSSPLASPPRPEDSRLKIDVERPVVDLVVNPTGSLEGRLARRLFSGGMKPTYHRPPLLKKWKGGLCLFPPSRSQYSWTIIK